MAMDVAFRSPRTLLINVLKMYTINLVIIYVVAWPASELSFVYPVVLTIIHFTIIINFLGGIVGSLAAAFKGRGKYKSVVEVIMYDMTPSQQEKLVASIHRALENIGPEDFVFIGALVMQNSSMQKMIIMELTKFLKNEMGLAIAS